MECTGWDDGGRRRWWGLLTCVSWSVTVHLGASTPSLQACTSSALYWWKCPWPQLLQKAGGVITVLLSHGIKRGENPIGPAGKCVSCFIAYVSGGWGCCGGEPVEWTLFRSFVYVRSGSMVLGERRSLGMLGLFTWTVQWGLGFAVQLKSSMERTEVMYISKQLCKNWFNKI